MQKKQKGNQKKDQPTPQKLGMKNEQPKEMIFASGSLVFGVISILLCTYYGGVLGILGIILGIISFVRHEPGKNVAIAGIITSVLGMLIMVLVLVIMATPAGMLQ